MKNNLLFFLVFMLCVNVVPMASATPPRDMQVVYNINTQSLEISMNHVSIELREHYIRTIHVTVNDGEPQVFRYPFQRKPSIFEAIIPLALNPGDSVVVRAECKLGGSAEAQLDIPLGESDETDGISEIPQELIDGIDEYPEGK